MIPLMRGKVYTLFELLVYVVVVIVAIIFLVIGNEPTLPRIEMPDIVPIGPSNEGGVD